MKGDKEFVGTLRGFDDYVSIRSNYITMSWFRLECFSYFSLTPLDMVLDDVTELYVCELYLFLSLLAIAKLEAKDYVPIDWIRSC
jgi:hypothetical protein